MACFSGGWRNTEAGSYRTRLPAANAGADPADGRDRTARTAGADAAERAKCASRGGRPDGA